MAVIAGLALGALLGPGASALAVDQDVEATSTDSFSPKDVTVTVGDTVHWHNRSGVSHNVHFDESGQRIGGDPVTHDPSPEWNADFKFNSPGKFSYHCDQHSFMTGSVTVQPATGDGGGDTTSPTISELKAHPGKLCNKKSKKCKKPGTKITFTLSEPASVQADVINTSNGSGPTIIFTKQGKAGKNTVKWSGKANGKRLKRAKYSLRLFATDAAGNKSQPAAIKIAIKKKRG